MDRTFQGQDPERPERQVASYYTSDEEERTNTTSTGTSESGDPSSTGCGTSQGETKSGNEEEEEEDSMMQFTFASCTHGLLQADKPGTVIGNILSGTGQTFSRHASGNSKHCTRV